MILNYQRFFQHLPQTLQNVIDPLSKGLRDFVWQAAQSTAPNSIVIDAGSGYSPYRAFFNHAKYFSIDSGQGDAGWNYSNISIRGDLCQLPFSSNIADIVICTQVLEHVPEPQIVIEELYRIMKPNGVLYLTAPQGWGEHQVPHDYFRFTSFALNRMFSHAGFSEIVIQPMGGFFIYLGNRIAQAPKYLFSAQPRRLFRWFLLPLEIVLLITLSGIAPAVCYWLDRFDHKHNYTLVYTCTCRKSTA